MLPPSTFRVSSASHFVIVCSLSMCVLYPLLSLSTLPLTHHHLTPHFTQPFCHVLGILPFHPQTCQNSSLSSTLLSPPSTIIHAPIWCHGRSPSTGQRAACSPNGAPSGSCSACATTFSGLPSTLPRGGSWGSDQTSRKRQLLTSMLALVPVTLSNAPRNPGQLGCHVQLLSVSPSWRA